jgi:hypothetical protein
MIPQPPPGFAPRRQLLAVSAACALLAATLGFARATPPDFPARVDAADDQAIPAAPPGPGPRRISLVGVDTPADPAIPSPSAGSSPAETSGPFDATRGDLGEDDDLATRGRTSRRGRGFTKPADIDKLPDPLRGTPPVRPDTTGGDAEKLLAKELKPRSDSWADWSAGIEPLHFCGEPRWLPPCVPPPPCHPSQPPWPYDLVGVRGEPTDGPIYRGPCQPRTGTHDDCPHPHLHRLHDRLFDWFYIWK